MRLEVENAIKSELVRAYLQLVVIGHRFDDLLAVSFAELASNERSHTNRNLDSAALQTKMKDYDFEVT